MRVLYIDIESRSPVDLKKSGVYRYAENRWTQIILLSWAIDNGPVSTWYIIRGEPCPPLLRAAIINPNVTMVAHNASFERVMLSVAGPRQIEADLCAEFRKIPRWDCTAARSCSIGLPRSLENVADALHLETTKDKDGYYLMLGMCRPIGFLPDNSPIWREADHEVQRLGQYCETDVEVEVLVDRRVPQLLPTERRIWELTERMNDRGIEVDRDLVDNVSVLVREAEIHVNARIMRATNGQVEKVTQHQALRDWLVGNGYPDIAERGVGKPVIADMLESEDLPDFIREVLIMRREGGKSSAAKYKAINLRLNGDNRARGALMYCGAASTGRFSSMGIQLQNLPRGGTIKQMHLAIDLILDGADIHEVEKHFGAPLVVASEALRPCFIARDGCWLARGDFGQIEARVLAWIAGEKAVIQAFRLYDIIIGYDEKGKPIRKGPDLYVVTAAQVYGVHPSEIDDIKRQVGKVTILACGYQGGVGAFQAFAKVYNLKVPDGLAEATKQAWRAANPNIVQLWWDLDNAAKDCLRGEPGVKHVVRPGLWFVRGTSVMTMRLPSGRSLFYWEPKLVEKKAPWGMTEVVRYWSMNHMKKKWDVHYGYGGLWAENMTQAVARDIMTFALENLEEAGFPPVLTVHDEAVCEVDQGRYGTPSSAAQAVIDVMLKVPVWASGLPLAVDGSAGPRYVKG